MTATPDRPTLHQLRDLSRRIWPLRHQLEPMEAERRYLVWTAKDEGHTLAEIADACQVSVQAISQTLKFRDPR